MELFKNFAILALLGNLSQDSVFKTARADQPVHCLRDDAFGVWNFHVSKQTEVVNLFQTDEVCTHALPNKVQIVSGSHKFAFGESDTWKVKLMDNYKVEASHGQSTVQGTWSTIYDQAFRVELDNGMRFISNFRYNIKDKFTKDPVADGYMKFSEIKAGDYDSFDSRCDQSMVGFVQQVGGNGSMKNHNVQCFYAEQVEHYNIEKSELQEDEEGVKIDRIVQKNGAGSLSQETDTSASAEQADDDDIFAKTSHKRMNAHHEHVPSDETDLLIEAINNLDLGWKADTCKY